MIVCTIGRPSGFFVHWVSLNGYTLLLLFWIDRCFAHEKNCRLVWFVIAYSCTDAFSTTFRLFFLYLGLGVIDEDVHSRAAFYLTYITDMDDDADCSGRTILESTVPRNDACSNRLIPTQFWVNTWGRCDTIPLAEGVNYGPLRVGGGRSGVVFIRKRKCSNHPRPHSPIGLTFWSE